MLSVGWRRRIRVRAEANVSIANNRSFAMHRFSQLLTVVVASLGLALVVVGCSSKEDKMKEGKMKEDKMKEDNMKDDKMKDDKMKDDKMKEDKMKEDKMKEDKMKEDKMKGDMKKDDMKKSGSLWRPWTAEQPQLAVSRLLFGPRVYGV
jgi:pentapeptide MXKDX repeat protein